MKNVKWIIDEYLVDTDVMFHKMKEAILAIGDEYHVTKYIPFVDAKDLDWGPYDPNTDCIILYGTHGMLKKCPYPFIPGAWGLVPQMSSEYYYASLPVEWMLNDDFIILPYAIVKARYNEISENGNRKFFLRPISGTKIFAGQVIAEPSYLFNLNVGSSVSEETLCIVAPFKKIEEEYRFVIANQKVIVGSMYNADNKLLMSPHYDQGGFDIAKKMAEYKWQPDNVYTCDVAKIKKDDGSFEYKIIELNSFSCAGLYACDRITLVKELHDAALKEFTGEI